MLRNPYTKWLRDSRRSILGWTVAIVIAGAGYASFWPTVDNPEMKRLLESYPQGVLEALNYTQITTPAGYLTATVYGLIVAALLTVYAIAAGTRTIAGDEDAGTLDLVLAHPVSRSSLALQRFAALVTSLIVITTALLLALLAVSRPARLDSISLGEFAAMHVHLVLFATFFAALAFTIGAGTGRRGLALGITAGVAVVGYAANGIIPMLEGMEWVRRYSPFHWLVGADPLTQGIHLPHVGFMLVLVVGLAGIGSVAFTRRDVGV